MTIESMTPTMVCDYLIGAGWRSIDSRVSYVAIFHSPAEPTTEVQIPLDKNLSDFSEGLSAALSRIASYETRAPSALIRDIIDALVPHGHVPVRRRFAIVSADSPETSSFDDESAM